MLQIALSTPDNLETLGRRWRALEAGAAASFFQSWTWVGCEAATRFPDPILIEAVRDGRTLALALCNRTRGWAGATLWLGESGAAAWDSVFVEHNGPLLAARSAVLSMKPVSVTCTKSPERLPVVRRAPARSEPSGRAPGSPWIQAREALKRVGLADRLHHRPTQLSVGQQQRVAMARALAGRPTLVLADEPTANLDRARGATCLDLLTAFARECEAALLVVTHDPEVQARFARHETLFAPRAPSESAQVSV